MLRLILALSLIAGAASAQSTEQYFDTQQRCGKTSDMFKESFVYDEQPLFGGETLQFDRRGEENWGLMLFTANQNTGFWTLYTFYGEDLVCITASGVGFAPIVD
jgi:hypothetical protein